MIICTYHPMLIMTTFLNHLLITKTKDDKVDVPPDTYFKAFFAFALWGYIPPPGYKQYQSLMMKTLLDDDDVVTKSGKRNLSCAACKKKKEKKSRLQQRIGQKRHNCCS